MTDTRDPIAFCTRVLEEDPASGAFVRLAEAHHAAGRARETIEVCRRGLALHPKNLRARVLLGLALKEIGETAGAVAELEAAKAALEENASLYRALAELRWESGEPEEARLLLDLYTRMAPGDSEALGRMAAWGGEEAPAPWQAPETALADSAAWGKMAASTTGLKAGKEPPPEPASGAEPPQRGQAKVLGVLSNWLEKADQKKPQRGREPKKTGGFSDAEREALRRLLLTKRQ